MEENKVMEMENQVEVIDENQVPTEVIDDTQLTCDGVDEKETPAIPGIVLGAGVVLGGIALYKGVKAGITIGRKAKRKVQERLNDWHVSRAAEIMMAREEAEKQNKPTESDNPETTSEESEK